MANITYEIASKLDEAGFKEAAIWMQKNQDQLKQSKEHANAFGQASGDLKSELLGFASVVGVIELFKSFTEAAAKNEQATLQLAGTYESINGSGTFSKVKAQVDEFTAALAENTRFSKTEQLQALDLMTQRTRDLGTSENLLTDAMGLAIKRHMDLATASDLVAGAHEHNQRSVMQLGRAMGLTQQQMKDQDSVLRTLHERYGAVATSEDSFESKQAKFNSTLEEFKVTVGNGLIPALTLIMDYLGRGVKALEPLIGAWVAWESMMVQILVGVGTVIYDVLTFHWRSIKSDAASAMEGTKLMWKDFTENLSKTADAFKTHAKAALVDPLHALPPAAQAMLDTTKALIAKFNSEGVQNETAAFNAKVKAFKAETVIRREQLAQQLADQKETAANIQKALVAFDADTNRQLAQLYEERYKALTQAAEQSGAAIGLAVGQMLAGQNNAWKTGMKSVIDTVIKTTEGIIIANYMAGASQEVARGGWIGVAAGAALISLGFAAAQGVLDAVLSGTGTATPASAPAGSSAAMSVNSAASAPSPSAASAAPGITNVNISIDQMYGSKQYVDMLARILTDGVQSGGTRLVASGVK